MDAFQLELAALTREGYCCSQILMLLLLRGQGGENPGLTRALSGLCHGLGQSGGTCGLLTGGACVLGYMSGKGAEAENALPMAQPLVNDYAEWFTERASARYGGISCPNITGDIAGRAPASGGPACAGLLRECWNKLLDLLEAYGIDSARPPAPAGPGGP